MKIALQLEATDEDAGFARRVGVGRVVRRGLRGRDAQKRAQAQARPDGPVAISGPGAMRRRP